MLSLPIIFEEQLNHLKLLWTYKKEGARGVDRRIAQPCLPLYAKQK